MDYPVLFAGLTKTDGSFLIGRTAEPDFKWESLKGKTIVDYDTNITATVNVASAALTLGGADRTADIGFAAVVEAALAAPQQ